MKKIINIVLTMAILFGVASVASLFGERVYADTDGIYTYAVSGGEATIKKCSDTVSAKIIIPSTLGDYAVTSISNNAFKDCSKLTKVTLPKSVVSIASDSFNTDNKPTLYFEYNEYLIAYCYESHLDYVLIGDQNNPSEAIFEYDIYGSEAVITGCSDAVNLEITVPSTVGGYTVTRIYSYSFLECSNLTSITLPKNVTKIDYRAFRMCESLKNINVDSENATYSSLDGVVFDKLNTTLMFCSEGRTGEYTVPDGVNSIYRNAFQGCSSLEDVTLPNSVTSIGIYAFNGCSELKSVTLPNSITSIGYGAFSGCSGLKSVTLPNSITSIESSSFSGCSGLNSVFIPASVSSLCYSAFGNCSNLTNIDVDSGNAEYSSVDGVVFNKTKTTLILCPPGKIGNYDIFDGVTIISSCAFYTCSGLTNVTVPKSVTSISYDAFIVCSNLTNINVHSENANYLSVDGVVFDKAKTMLVTYPAGKNGEYSIPNSVITIGKHAFAYCSKLISITIPNSVTSVGDNAFMRCSGLKSIALPESVTSTGRGAFDGCSGLTRVIISNNLKTINESTFYGCSGLKSITLPNSVTSIGSGAFGGCSGLKIIVLPSMVTYISSDAFGESFDPTNDKPTLYFKQSDYLTNYCYNNNIYYVIINNTNNFQLDIAKATYDSIAKKIDISVNINNTSYNTVNSTLLLSIYDSTGKLVKVQRHNVTIDYFANTIDKSVTLAQDLKPGCTAKAMLMSDTEHMIPIAVSGVLNVN